MNAQKEIKPKKRFERITTTTTTAHRDLRKIEGNKGCCCCCIVSYKFVVLVGWAWAVAPPPSSPLMKKKKLGCKRRREKKWKEFPADANRTAAAPFSSIQQESDVCDPCPVCDGSSPLSLQQHFARSSYIVYSRLLKKVVHAVRYSSSMLHGHRGGMCEQASKPTAVPSASTKKNLLPFRWMDPTPFFFSLFSSERVSGVCYRRGRREI